ncbi:hypothetical protein D3C75_1326330 [compost metagenome]
MALGAAATFLAATTFLAAGFTAGLAAVAFFAGALTAGLVTFLAGAFAFVAMVKIRS